MPGTQLLQCAELIEKKVRADSFSYLLPLTDLTRISIGLNCILVHSHTSHFEAVLGQTLIIVDVSENDWG
jgi:hypothetical protein